MAKKTDANQQAVIDCFRQLGYSVLDLHEVGGGCPDLLIAKHGENFLIEVKAEKGKLNELQEKFIDLWNTDVYVIRSIDDVIKFSENILTQ